MLKRIICKKCDYEYIQRHFNKGDRPEKWSNKDDERWKTGYVFCWVYSNFIRTESIPDYCPYKLEHLVLEKGE